jgi:hypothetical protein
MDRRHFLKLTPAVVLAGIVAPKLLIPKEGNKYFIGYDPATNNSISVIACKSRRKGMTWIQQAEWQFHKDWQRDQERQFTMYISRQGMIDFDKVLKKQVQYFRNDNLFQFLKKIEG